MSYKTNPILNRIKMNKGWKNPYFPTKALNYSRDLALWFKVYLFLKIFLNFKKIQLVTFEVRQDQKNKKILYLSINKKGYRIKKRKKKKLASNRILKKIRTPMRKKIHKGAIFFFYKNLPQLKKLTFWKKNVMQKKILSRSWLTQPNISWLNSFKKILFARQKTRKNWPYLKKNEKFVPWFHQRWHFYTNKRKKIWAKIEKLRRKNIFWSLRFLMLYEKKKDQMPSQFLRSVKKEYDSRQKYVQQLRWSANFLSFLQKASFPNKNKKIQIKKKAKRKILLQRMQKQKLHLFWKLWKKQVHSLNRVRFLSQKLPFIRLNWQNWQKNSVKKKNQLVWSFLKNHILLKRMLHLNFLTSQMSNQTFWRKNSFIFTRFYLKSKIGLNKWPKTLSEPKNPFLQKNLQKLKRRNLRKIVRASESYYNIAIWILFRFVWKIKAKGKRQEQLRFFRKKMKKFRKKLSKKTKFQLYRRYTRFLAQNKFVRQDNQKKILAHIKKIGWDLTQHSNVKYYRYHWPYKQTHFRFQQFQTHFQLKYLIQDVVQKAFSIQVETKFVHIFNAQKNTKFFRLVFPVWKKKRNIRLRKWAYKNGRKKEIFLATRFHLVSPKRKISSFFKKPKKQIPQSLKKQNKKKRHIRVQKPWIPSGHSSLMKKNTMKMLSKKDRFIRAESQRLKRILRSSFDRTKRNKDFRNIYQYLIPTLIQFSYSYEPQLLADAISKVIKKAKKQTWLIKTIKYLLRAIHLPRNVGFKILLTGRINSKKKTRKIYITQKKITLQVFQNNMNFASAQANARIGAFGVKVWVYAKKFKKWEKL